MRRDELRLRDILEHINSALLAVAGKLRSDFDADPILQKAVQYDLLTIGEATSNISEELRTKYSQVPWKAISGIRTILAHQYFSIDLDIVWQTATSDLAPLRAQIEEILNADFPGGTTSA
jgi:uncharacterized protein with HEPN domain